MKNVSLILSIVAILAAAAFGVILLSDKGEAAESTTEGTVEASTAAKGGIVMAIRDQLGLPVRYIGLGEQPQDLRPFDIESYLYGICEGMGNHE